MKKVTLLIAALFCSAIMFGEVHFGPQIGFAASTLKLNKSEIEESLKSNFVFGVFLRIGEKIYVQPEVNWLTQGSVFKYPSFGDLSPVEQEVDLKTIQIPVSLGWRVLNLKIVNLRVFAGVTANYVTDVKIDTKNGDPEEYLQPDDFSNMIWQYQAGVGVDVLMFALDVKYMGGLNDMFKNDITYDGTSLSTKSNIFLVTLGWKIF